MKILYVGNKLSEHGYSVTSVETLGPLLQNMGYDVMLVSNKRNETLRMLHITWSIIMNAKSVGLVLIDAYSTRNFYVTIVVAWLCKVLRLRYVPILRGGKMKNRFERSPRLSRFVFGNSHTNVAPSGFLAELLKEKGFQSVLIPNNIPISNYRFDVRSTMTPRILWVRAFHHIYNPQLAIHALHELVKTNKEARLCMVGPDKDGTMEECRKLIDFYQLNNVVEMKGYMEKKDWIELSANYDLFLNTTTEDNTPISVIEAMALGLPVVSTNVGGLPYLLDDLHDALLFDSNDKHQLVYCINKLCNDKEMVHQLSLNARKKVETFDWELISNQWKELIDSAL